MNEARTWLNVPWRHQGRTRQGIDCAGLVVKVAHALNLSDFDYTAYQRTAQRQRLMSYFAQEMDTIPVTEAREGDVILFRDKVYPCHVAMVTSMHGELYIIHAHATRKKVIEEPLSGWKDRWVAAYRFKGVI